MLLPAIIRFSLVLFAPTSQPSPSYPEDRHPYIIYSKSSFWARSVMFHCFNEQFFFFLAALLLTIVQINLRFGTKVESIWSRLVIFHYRKNSILRTTMLLRLMHCLPWEQIHFSNCMVLFNVFQQMNIDTRYVLTVKPFVLIS